MTNSKPFLEEVLLYFDPISEDTFEIQDQETGVGTLIQKNLQNTPLPIETKVEIAIFCIDSPFINKKTKKNFNSNEIRKELYKLKGISSHLNIVDLGNLKTGINITDALFALQEVSILLNKNNIVSIILGGSQMYTIGSFIGLKEFETGH